jgi:hypothetical protein
VTGQWLVRPDGRTGIGVVIFESEDAADSAAKGPRSYPHDDDRAWNVVDFTVYEELASADRQPVRRIDDARRQRLEPRTRGLRVCRSAIRSVLSMSGIARPA